MSYSPHPLHVDTSPRTMGNASVSESHQDKASRSFHIDATCTTVTDDAAEAQVPNETQPTEIVGDKGRQEKSIHL